MSRGKVKWFSNQKGYGFITVEGGGPDVFVHFKQVVSDGYKTLHEHQAVQFDIIQGPKGPQAGNVKPL